MSISGPSGSSFLQSLYAPDSPNQQSPRARFAQEFQQLGQDLQSGNLAQAQSNFAALTAGSPFAPSSQASAANTTSSANTNATAVPASTNPIAQAFTQLSQDLQAGNLTAAQSDYANIQQDFQQQAAAVANHPHHHHHHAAANHSNTQSANSASSPFASTGATASNGSAATAGSTSSANTGTSLDQTLLALSQALQSGNLATAQQSYTSLLQEFQQAGALGANTTTASKSVEGSFISAAATSQLLNLTV